MYSYIVYGKKDGKLIKGIVTESEQDLPDIISHHQPWLKKELGVSSPVFGLIIGEPNELLSV